MAKKKNTADEQVQQLLALVKQKKEQITKAEKPDWKTSCSFSYDPASNSRTNIQTVRDVDALVQIFAFLKAQERNYNEAAATLGVESKFKWMGHTVAEWQADIQSRIGKIQIQKNKQDLETLESRLDKLISPEMRRELELAEITKMLGVE